VIVHQIVNLELQNIKGSNGKRKGREFEPARDSGENKEEEHTTLPSSYCTILFNDELVSYAFYLTNFSTTFSNVLVALTEYRSIARVPKSSHRSLYLMPGLSGS
jgi:hypothetical protein